MLTSLAVRSLSRSVVVQLRSRDGCRPLVPRIARGQAERRQSADGRYAMSRDEAQSGRDQQQASTVTGGCGWILSGMAATLAAFGRVLVGGGLAAFGVLQFIYGDFVTGRAAPWPAGWPGQVLWAVVSGALMVVAGVAIVDGRRARPAGLLAGALVLVWALLRHVPAVLADPHGIVLTSAGKALAIVGALSAVAGTARPLERQAGPFARALNAQARWVTVSRWCLGVFLVIGGVQHFVYIAFAAGLVPAWVGHPREWAYAAGVALVAGGLGLLYRHTAPLAALLSGSMILSWVVLVHIPRVLGATAAQARNERTALVEALVMSGCAFVLAEAAMRDADRAVPRSDRPAIRTR